MPLGKRMGFMDLLLESFRDTDYRRLEAFPDYDGYHREKGTGNPERAQLVEAWIEPGSRVLDAGCGDGTVALRLKERLGLRVSAYDLSPTSIAKAVALGLDAEVKDLDADPTFPEGFDYILFVEVLEHLVRPHVVLRAATAAARKGVVVTFPNAGWLPFRVQVLRGHVVNQSFMHLHLWTHRDFLSFCAFLDVTVKDYRTLTSSSRVRRGLVSAYPNLLAHQVAYLIAGQGH